MFCKKCGNELKEGERFCGKCGALVEESSPAKNKGNSDVSFSTAGLHGNRKLVILYLSAAFIFILEIILWFNDVFKRSIWGYSESVSMSYYLNVIDGSICNVLIVLFNVAMAILCIVPLFANISKRRRLIVQKIFAIVDLGAFILFSVAAMSSASFDISFTFGGVLLLLSTIGSIVLLFVISSLTKKMNK